MKIYYGKRIIKKNTYSKFHRDKLIKYDKNNDNMISLDEYLAREESKGDKASPGTIDYDYQYYSNVYEYFYILFLKIRDFKIMCIPNMTVTFKNTENRVAVVYFKKENKIIMSANIKKAIDNCRCKKENRVRFIFFSFILIDNKNENFSHANIIIIDLFKQTLERFEPHGYYNSKNINKIIKKKLMKKMGIPKFKYLEPKKLSPYIGIQKKVDFVECV